MVFDKIKKAFSGSMTDEDVGDEYLEIDLGKKRRNQRF